MWVLLATVVLSVAAGLTHRRRDGRLRPSGGQSLRVQRAATAHSGGTGGAVGRNSHGPGPRSLDSIDPDLRSPGTHDPGTHGPDPRSARGSGGVPDSPLADGAPDLRPLLVGLGHTPGERATLVQFSSAFCAPCRATRRILGEVSEMVPGVAHIEIDAESQLALVRQLDIRKTPTTLVLDDQGREVKRATGAPRKAEVIAAVGSALPWAP